MDVLPTSGVISCGTNFDTYSVTGIYSSMLASESSLLNEFDIDCSTSFTPLSSTYSTTPNGVSTNRDASLVSNSTAAYKCFTQGINSKCAKSSTVAFTFHCVLRSCY